MPSLLISTVGAYGFALASWPILWAANGRVARVLAIAFTLLVLVVPMLLLPAQRVGLRALVGVICIDLFFKMVDYLRQGSLGHQQQHRFSEYLRFLIPFPAMLVQFGARDQRLLPNRSRQRDILRVLIGTLLFGTGFVLVEWASYVPIIRSNFLLDHCLKVAIFVLTIEALSRCLHGVEHLAGFNTTPIIRNAFLAQSVGEFWYRYNARVHSWFDRNVFRPSGGRRAPAKGVFLVFFVSAVLHEIGFGIATSRFDGYQFAFFMLQAPAVLLSRPLHRIAKRHGFLGDVAARGTTVAWMTLSSMLFFHGVNRVFPFFYASEPWLP